MWFTSDGGLQALTELLRTQHVRVYMEKTVWKNTTRQGFIHGENGVEEHNTSGFTWGKQCGRPVKRWREARKTEKFCEKE